MRAAPLLLVALIFAAGPADAQEDSACQSCRAEDEMQAGDYTPPEIPQVAKPDLPDPRGKEVRLPVSGLPGVRYRPGAGVYMGEVGAGNNLFLKPGRDKVSVGMKRDF
jgi:hypothetical protein